MPECRHCGEDLYSKPTHTVQFRENTGLSCVHEDCWEKIGVDQRVDACRSMLMIWPPDAAEDWDEIEAAIRAESPEYWKFTETETEFVVTTEDGVRISIPRPPDGTSEWSHRTLVSNIQGIMRLKFELSEARAELQRVRTRMKWAMRDEKKLKEQMSARIAFLK